jgi:hypothetical protein
MVVAIRRNPASPGHEIGQKAIGKVKLGLGIWEWGGTSSSRD